MHRIVVPVVLAVTFGLALPVSAHPAARRKRNPIVWLNSAHLATKQAGERLTSAELTHEFDAEGHATRAKELISQAKAELELSIQYVKDHPTVADTH